MASKQCKKCGEMKSTLDFPRSRAPWFADGTADICYSCFEKMYNPKDLNSVDKLLQYLDIQFDPNGWIEVVRLNPQTAFQNYTTKTYAKRVTRNMDWTAANEAWKKMDEKDLEKHIDVMNADWIEKMKKRWGDYTVEQYQILQSFYDNVDRTQNIVTAIQRDQAQNMARLSLVIRKRIQAGEDASKEMKAYNDYIKSAGFQPKNARNYGDFESVGQLINFLVKKGYTPKFYHQNPKERDLVDLTLKNTQSYLRRLVHNQPGLADLVEERKNSYKIAQQLQQEGIDNDLDRYDSETARIDYQDDGVSFQEALNE